MNANSSEFLELKSEAIASVFKLTVSNYIHLERVYTHGIGTIVYKVINTCSYKLFKLVATIHLTAGTSTFCGHYTDQLHSLF